MKTEIIAEIGQNHNGDMDLAKKLIQAAKESGADVAKFQLFDAVALFPKENNPWYDYNCKTELTKDQVFELFDECNKAGIEFMASVFDVARVAWLEELGVKRYKLASRSIRDTELINAIYGTKKPVIVSLGMWNEKELPVMPDPSRTDFLYCIAQYPTKLEDVHLASVDFNTYAGFSDHTIGISAPLVALSRGARIIEKHLTLDKNMYGPDHSGSATPEELKKLHDFRADLEQLL